VFAARDPVVQRPSTSPFQGEDRGFESLQGRHSQEIPDPSRWLHPSAGRFGYRSASPRSSARLSLQLCCCKERSVDSQTELRGRGTGAPVPHDRLLTAQEIDFMKTSSALPDSGSRPPTSRSPTSLQLLRPLHFRCAAAPFLRVASAPVSGVVVGVQGRESEEVAVTLPLKVKIEGSNPSGCAITPRAPWRLHWSCATSSAAGGMKVYACCAG
jgi:hypothetical protein